MQILDQLKAQSTNSFKNFIKPFIRSGLIFDYKAPEWNLYFKIALLPVLKTGPSGIPYQKVKRILEFLRKVDWDYFICIWNLWYSKLKFLLQSSLIEKNHIFFARSKKHLGMNILSFYHTKYNYYEFKNMNLK